MKKMILKYGLIAGAIVAIMMACTAYLFMNNPEFKGNEIIGFAGIFIASSFIFVGIKSYRDKENAGVITFGRALKIGLLIALIASAIYVAVWLVEYYFFFPDFMDKFSAMRIKQLSNAGLDAAKLQAKIAEVNEMKASYKNPLYIIFMTAMEVLPIGIVFALISALILKKKVV
ncbi:MAG: DUF4199 domain-containing protein [Flavobacterium sp.]|nr:DUF4199 domain-containing protein [Flavobacterium sp.]